MFIPFESDILVKQAAFGLAEHYLNAAHSHALKDQFGEHVLAGVTFSINLALEHALQNRDGRNGVASDAQFVACLFALHVEHLIEGDYHRAGPFVW